MFFSRVSIVCLVYMKSPIKGSLKGHVEGWHRLATRHPTSCSHSLSSTRQGKKIQWKILQAFKWSFLLSLFPLVCIYLMGIFWHARTSCLFLLFDMGSDLSFVWGGWKTLLALWIFCYKVPLSNLKLMLSYEKCSGSCKEENVLA